MGDRGLEHNANSTGKTAIPATGAAKCAAIPADRPPVDQTLELIIRAWPSIPARNRKTIIEMANRALAKAAAPAEIMAKPGQPD
jgi:hypothetical protein